MCAGVCYGMAMSRRNPTATLCVRIPTGTGTYEYWPVTTPTRAHTSNRVTVINPHTGRRNLLAVWPDQLTTHTPTTR